MWRPALWLYLLLSTVTAAWRPPKISPHRFPLVSSRNSEHITFEVETEYGVKLIPPLPIRKELSCYRVKLGHLVYMSTPKCGSTQMRRIMCELILRDEGVEITPEVNDDVENSRPFCMRSQGLVQAGQLLGWNSPKNKLFFIWRDPVDRFISQYGYICKKHGECGEAGESLHTAAKGFYNYLQYGQLPKGASNVSNFRHHITPQSWHCDIGEQPGRFQRVEYTQDSGELVERLRPVLDWTGMPPEDIDAALNRLLTSNTNEERAADKKVHKYDMWREEVLKNRTTLGYVLAINYHDYRLFQKELPKIPPK
ncbi:unnamed protein product, partial [Mesorhabditis spiculigera]